MHDILFPKRRITRLYNATRHPDQATIVARIPVVGRRVPMRGYWRRQSFDPKRALSHSVGAIREHAPIVTDRAAALGAATARAAVLTAERRWPQIRSAAQRQSARARDVAAERLPEAQEFVTDVGEASMDHARQVAKRQMPKVRRQAARAREAAIEQMPVVRERASDMAQSATASARTAAAGGAKRGRSIIAHAPKGKLTLVLAAFSFGAVLMYFFDQASGRRRRALVRDKAAHLRRIVTHDTRRAVGRRSRFFRGVARGVRHDAAELLPHRHARVDDDTLVARVRSDVLRRASVPAGDVHVDVYEGCVTLRGQLTSEDEIRRVVDATRHLDGVADVRSYLHLPGTPPPNKAESMANGHAPAHLVR